MEHLQELGAVLGSLRGLQRSSMNETNENRRDQPREEHLAFIPTQLHDNTITLNATTLNREHMKTVFIGITTSSYTPSMWDEDARKWMNDFQLLKQNCTDVKMQELRDSPGKVDCARAVVEINAALVILSNVPCGEPIRVICLSPSMAQLTLDTLTYLIREWKTSDDTVRLATDKKLQVVTTGDSSTFNLFKLCQRLCIAGVCQSIEFYDTMSYYPFGHYRQSYFFKY